MVLLLLMLEVLLPHGEETRCGLVFAHLSRKLVSVSNAVRVEVLTEPRLETH